MRFLTYSTNPCKSNLRSLLALTLLQRESYFIIPTVLKRPLVIQIAFESDLLLMRRINSYSLHPRKMSSCKVFFDSLHMAAG